MARFSGIPALPEGNIEEWQIAILGPIKQNVELLTGTRGELDGASRALLRGDVDVAAPPASQFVQLSARGVGVTVSGVSVPTLTDYVNLLRDVQALGNDVVRLRATVEALIQQLRG
jgi:hypothetical protein